MIRELVNKVWSRKHVAGAAPPGDSMAVVPAALDFMARIDRCCALQSEVETVAATSLVEALNLESHEDARKNWDSLKAIYYVTKYCDPTARVLDAGSSTSSAILKWLSRLGYRELHGCNLKNKAFQEYADIHFSRQDIRDTDYPDGYFRTVTCLSVIEHVESPELFFREMQRIIAVGGLLVLSTDYWSERIDCTGIYPYGKDMPAMKVFTPEEMDGLCRLADESGFRLLRPWEPETRDRAIRWERVDREYTFAFLAMERVA